VINLGSFPGQAVGVRFSAEATPAASAPAAEEKKVCF